MEREVPEYACEVIKVLINRHNYGGSPVPKEAVISFAAVPSNDLDQAKETFDELRKSPDFSFVANHGPKHVLLDNSRQDVLADFLHSVCGWEVWKIDSKLKHYEGIDDHDF